MRGQMLWFNEVKDYGFIMTDEGERLAVAGNGFAKGEKPEGRCAHKVVTFEVDETTGERQAQNVVFEQETVAPAREDAERRARNSTLGGVDGDEEAAADDQQAQPRARDRGEANAQAAGQGREARGDQERRGREAGLARASERAARRAGDAPPTEPTPPA